MKTVKIGIDARMFSDSFTGIGRYNYELTKRLFDQEFLDCDIDIEWVLFMNEPEFSKFNFPANVKKVAVNAKHYSWAEQTSFLKSLKQENCDLVHFTHFNVPIGYRKQFLVTIHDTTISFFPGKKMKTPVHKLAYNQIIKHAVKNSKKIITVSHNTKKDVIELFGPGSEKIKVIWNGLGDEFVASSDVEKKSIKTKYNLSNDFLLYTGVWREHKNIVGLIEAFKKVSDDHDKGLNLVITGNADPFYPEVKAAVKSFNLESKVKFVGLVPFEDLVTLYAAASTFIFPSFYEGFGFPPLEAMSVNTPVAASNTSSIPEVCGEAALYFDPYRVDDIADKIKELLSSESLQEELIQKGGAQVKKFNWDACAKETFQQYLELL